MSEPQPTAARPPGSLRFRLLAGAAAWIALALAAAGLLLADLFASHARQRLEAELSAHLNQLAAGLTVGADGVAALRQPPGDPRFHQPLSGLYWQAEAPEQPPLRSRSLWDGAMALPRDELTDGVLHRHSLPGPAGARLIVLERSVLPPDAARRVRLAVGVDAAELTAATAAFNRPLAASLLALWLALAAAAVVQVQVGLRPLARLRARLADVRAGRLRRLPGDIPSEIKPLADDLNAVLDHDDGVVARARLEAGNLAHALKTDLAVLRNDAMQLGRGENGNAPEAARVAALVDRMTRHIDRHMARARAAASAGTPGARAPVAAAAAQLLRAMERLHGERNLRFSAQIPAALVFAGDGQDLTEMLGNLLDNACKWADSVVSVTATAQDDGQIVIVVADDGPGLPAAARAAALQAGVRLDESAPGSGLGLAVTVDLAALYGGALHLDTAETGGLAAILRLPGG